MESDSIIFVENGNYGKWAYGTMGHFLSCHMNTIIWLEASTFASKFSPIKAIQAHRYA